MRAIPKWLPKWIAHLLPSQRNSGDGVVQIGKMGGGNVVTIVHLTLPPVPTPVPTPAPAPVPPASAKPVARLVPPAALPARPTGVANEEQRHVLHLIRQVPYPTAVHEFMQREFGTHMVIHLQPPQLYRVRRYVEKIIQTTETAASAAGPFEQIQGRQR